VNRHIFSFILFLLSSSFVSGQVTAEKADSTKFYAEIETYSQRSRFGKFMYTLIFKPVAIIRKKDTKKKVYKKLIQKPYSTFEGKPVRNIEIVTVDPFGYTINDTSKAKLNYVFRTGNSLHIKTQPAAIRNLLLFRKNKPFNSYLVKESERLIRMQKYVRDVSFSVIPAGKKSDSADIIIREMDKWTINPNGSVSASGIKLSLSDINFLGTGHEFRNAYSNIRNDGYGSFNTNYSVPNIKNSYISTDLHYGSDGYGNFRRSASIDRPFFSSYAKWAAGISVASQYKKDSVKYINLVSYPENLRFNTADLWGGYAKQIFKGISEDELATNLILSLRYFRIRYSQTLSELYDPMHNFSDEDFYLVSAGISTRKYVQDTYIFNYGIIEDVPVGQVYSITAGYQLKNNNPRNYLGFRYSSGNYHQWGYLSSNIEYGTFFHDSKATQGVVSAGVNYFTVLLESGKWKFRQFIKPQLTIGINRFSYDSLTLNESYGINGFNSQALSGKNRLVVTFQTQSYSPWRFIGFHFGPFLSYSFGMLGVEGKGFSKSKVYNQLGVGVLIKNENLVFKSFQFSLSFYPLIPGFGQDIFKTNSFRTNDMGFRDFETGKPSPIIYR
jgi:hypothetical protein